MITLTDLLGRFVVCPVNAWHQPGRYDAEAYLSRVPVGLYIVRMRTSSADRSRTLPVVRR